MRMECGAEDRLKVCFQAACSLVNTQHPQQQALHGERGWLTLGPAKLQRPQWLYIDGTPKSPTGCATALLLRLQVGPAQHQRFFCHIRLHSSAVLRWIQRHSLQSILVSSAHRSHNTWHPMSHKVGGLTLVGNTFWNMRHAVSPRYIVSQPRLPMGSGRQCHDTETSRAESELTSSPAAF